VTYPAYDETSVSARSQVETLRADAAATLAQATNDGKADRDRAHAELETVRVCRLSRS